MADQEDLIKRVGELDAKMIALESRVDAQEERFNVNEKRLDATMKDALQSAVMSSNAKADSEAALKLVREISNEVRESVRLMVDKQINPRLNTIMEQLETLQSFQESLEWYQDLRKIFTSKLGLYLLLIIIALLLIADKMNITDVLLKIVEIYRLTEK